MDKIWSDFQKRYGDNTQSVTVCVNWNDLVKVFENNNNTSSASTAFVRNYMPEIHLMIIMFLG